MNRRRFLLQSTALSALGLLGRGALSAQTSAPTTVAPSPTSAPSTPPVKPEFRELRRKVGVFTARGGSIGWLVSDAALAVVDTQFPDTAALCLAGLPGRAERQIDVLINTHHHGDHTGGNPVFRPASRKHVAHANVPELQRAAAERARPPTLDKQVYADTTFADTWRQELGDEVVSARYFGPAHTKGDIVVLFEKANVVHMGDLMFNRRYPVIDRPGGANIRAWIGVLETVAKTYPADAIYIFGHSKAGIDVVGTTPDLLYFRDYLTALLEHVQKGIAAGKSKAEIAGLQSFPAFPDFIVPSPAPGPQRNIEIAYDELTGAPTG